jgi:hypothetical protein
LGKGLAAEHALKSQVVNGEQALGFLQGAGIKEPRFEISRDQAGLPIMQMHDVGGKIQGPGQLDHRAAKEDKAPGVVRKIAVLALIEPIAVIEGVLLDEVDRAALYIGLPYLGAEQTAVHRRLDLQPGVCGPGRGFFGLAVERQDQAHIVAQFAERRRQAARHVAQAAGFGQGSCLGRGHENLERT